MALFAAPDVLRRLVLAKPDIDRVPKEVVGRPGHIGDLGHELWLDLIDT